MGTARTGQCHTAQHSPACEGGWPRGAHPQDGTHTAGSMERDLLTQSPGPLPTLWLCPQQQSPLLWPQRRRSPASVLSKPPGSGHNRPRTPLGSAFKPASAHVPAASGSRESPGPLPALGGPHPHWRLLLPCKEKPAGRGVGGWPEAAQVHKRCRCAAYIPMSRWQVPVPQRHTDNPRGGRQSECI